MNAKSHSISAARSFPRRGIPAVGRTFRTTKGAAREIRTTRGKGSLMPRLVAWVVICAVLTGCSHPASDRDLTEAGAQPRTPALEATLPAHAHATDAAPRGTRRTDPEPTPVRRTTSPAAWLREFSTIDDAIDFVTEEDNIVAYEGGCWGSERFDVTLPSGRVVSNWRINNVFHLAFRRFGRAAHPRVLELLNHPHEYVRLGAHRVVGAFMHGRGISYHFHASERERRAAIRRTRRAMAQSRSLYPTRITERSAPREASWTAPPAKPRPDARGTTPKHAGSPLPGATPEKSR